MNLVSIPWDGKPISKPGMYSSIPMLSYHGNITDGPSVSTTGLKKLVNESAADYYDTSYLNQDRADDTDTSALIMGRAIHHLILGEPHFAKVFAEQPATYEDPETGEVKKWNGNSKECKRWDALRAKENRYVLTKNEVSNIRGIAKALATNELVQAGILNGLVERSLFWKDKKTGIWLKHRPDVIPTDSGDVCDLKKIRSVDWDTLQRNIFDFGYYQQGALSKWALKEVLDIEIQSFTLLFVEDKRPFSVRPVVLKDIDLEIGMVANRAALDIMARCLKEDRWPGPGALSGDHIEHIELSVWQKNSIALKLKLMGYDTPDFEGKH